MTFTPCRKCFNKEMKTAWDKWEYCPFCGIKLTDNNKVDL